jgi:pyridoxal phosphate enzyme (YggS family)
MLFEKNKLRLNQLYRTIKKACQEAGRSPDVVGLLAVCKNQSVEAILPLLEAGHKLFGENRVQEAAGKWPFLRLNYPGLYLHLIGPLQTNKVKEALLLFDVIESIDRPRLVLALAKEWTNPSRRTCKLLIQVNTGHEPQKSGVLVDDLPTLIDLCRQHSLPLTGLMCIPPAQEDPAPHFQLLANLAKQHNLTDLSMGMSNDFPIAIAEGAIWVRIGTALFSKTSAISP